MSKLTLKDLTAQCAAQLAEIDELNATIMGLRYDAETDAGTHGWLMAVAAGKIVDLEAQLLSVTSVANAINTVNAARKHGYWVAVDEYDDDYGQPAARTYGHFATEAEALAENAEYGVRFVPTPRPSRPAYVAPQWQIDRAAAMAAAKAQAMAGHTTVRV